MSTASGAPAVWVNKNTKLVVQGFTGARQRLGCAQPPRLCAARGGGSSAHDRRCSWPVAYKRTSCLRTLPPFYAPAPTRYFRAALPPSFRQAGHLSLGAGHRLRHQRRWRHQPQEGGREALGSPHLQERGGCACGAGSMGAEVEGRPADTSDGCQAHRREAASFSGRTAVPVGHVYSLLLVSSS